MCAPVRHLVCSSPHSVRIAPVTPAGTKTATIHRPFVLFPSILAPVSMPSCVAYRSSPPPNVATLASTLDGSVEWVRSQISDGLMAPPWRPGRQAYQGGQRHLSHLSVVARAGSVAHFKVLETACAQRGLAWWWRWRGACSGSRLDADIVPRYRGPRWVSPDDDPTRPFNQRRP